MRLRFAPVRCEKRSSICIPRIFIILRPNLRLIRGRESLIGYFEGIQAVIAEVQVSPLITWGDPARVVYQFCNTVRRAPNGGEISRAHYVAGFREVDGDWLIEMEVPALGHIAN